MEWLNYHHLYYFYLLDQLGSFTKVAEKLKISQSAVSEQILQLEHNLQKNLIDRTNKKFPKITEEGREVLIYARTIFETGNELLHWSKNSKQSQVHKIKIGALSGLSRNFQYEFISPVIDNANLKIEVQTGEYHSLIKLLQSHQLDLVLSSQRPPNEIDDSFFTHVLSSSPLYFVYSKKFSGERKLKLKDAILQKKIYLPGKNFEARTEIDYAVNKINPNATIAGEIDDIALLRLIALKSGELVAIPKLGLMNDLDNKDLVFLESPTDIKQQFYAITRRKKIENPFVKKLISNFRF